MRTNSLKLKEVIHQVVNDPAYTKISTIPVLSIHQIGLIIFSYLAVLGSISLHLVYQVPLWLIYPFIIFGTYCAFTPLHEATHRALSSHKFLNDFLGTVSAFLLLPFANTKGFRYIHMTHHRYVGDEKLDPDELLVSLPTRYFPFGYVILLFADYTWTYWLVAKVWKRTPLKTRINILWMLSANTLFTVGWLLSPYWYEFLILFLIPNRLGLAYLAFAFAHIQHPDGLKWHEHPFQSTYLIRGNFFYLKSLLGQSHHALHHFLPHVPWYRYEKAMELANSVLYTQPIPIRSAFSKPDKYFKEKLLKSKTQDETAPLTVRVSGITHVGPDIKSFFLEPLHQEELPAFSAGAHVVITLPSGKFRAYSLVNSPQERDRYQIAVKLEPQGKGGSREMHETVSVGDTLRISLPKNNFVLYEDVQKYILISGGIGITPLLSMAHRLVTLEKHFKFHICAKTKAQIPFQDRLNTWTFSPNIDMHVDQQGKSSMDLSKVLATPDKNTLVYVCGPSGFNHWIKSRALRLGWGTEQIQQEVFSNYTPTQTAAKAFDVHLQKRGKTLRVEKDMTIIDTLLLHDVPVEYTCLQGTCGTCITPVLEGEVDHQDAVLQEEEKMKHTKMCLCVSRAKGDKLVIDL